MTNYNVSCCKGNCDCNKNCNGNCKCSKEINNIYQIQLMQDNNKTISNNVPVIFDTTLKSNMSIEDYCSCKSKNFDE